MGLINKLFRKLFGGRKQEQDGGWSIYPPLSARGTSAPLTSLAGEQQERILEIELTLKDWMMNLITQKGGIAFTWESGNDEAFLDFTDYNDPDANKFADLEYYLVDKLAIPDAGEFQMIGSGTIYLDSGLVRAKYNSTMRGVIDYDEEAEKEIYSEEELDSGDEVLFAV